MMTSSNLPEPTRDEWRTALEALSALARVELPPTVRAALERARAETTDARSLDRALDRAIAAIDAIVHATLDDVLHDPSFQRLEAAWRGLAYLVDRASYHANVKLSIWSWTKDDLARDLEEATEVVASKTFAEVYTAEYGVFGGEPYAAILADMEIGADPRDVALLRKVASIAAMAHAPFFASASPALLQLGSWRELPTVTEVQGIFEAPRFIPWSSFRDDPNSRYVGLLLPRCLVREPYAATHDESPFGYVESIATDGAGLLWGSPVFPLPHAWPRRSRATGR